MSIDLKSFIRDVPDFPKPGIMFKDITPLLLAPKAFAEAIRQLADQYRSLKVEVVAGIESRGFIIGAPLAAALGVGFIPIRKPGKLPFTSRRKEYSLEYGKDSIEMHTDAVKPGQNVLLVDDVIATGGTARAAADLLKEAGGNLVGIAFLVELSFLGGMDKLKSERVFSLLKY